MILFFFSHREDAREFFDKVAGNLSSNERLAETSVDNCAGAMATYARIGRTLARPQMLVFHEFVESTFSTHVLEIYDEQTD